MKVRRLNRKCGKSKSKLRWLQSTKVKFVILQQVNVLSLLLLQIFAAIENYQYSENFTYELSNSCKHFIRSISLPSVHLKQAAIFNF